MGCSGRASAGKGRRRNLRHRPRSTVYVVFLTLSSLAVVDADSSRAAEGEQQHAAKNRDDTAVAGLGDIVLAGVGLPGGGVDHGLRHILENIRRPADEAVALAGGLAVERGGIGAGQQSRIHCTRLAGQKADNWLLRQSPQVLSLPFKEGMKRAERDNAIDNYIGEDYMDVLADGCWEKYFTEKPPVFTKEEKQKWLSEYAKDVRLGSDAFFPFDDNIERAYRSGVKYIAQPGGSIRDKDCIDACNRHNMVMSFTGIRLFHH